MAAWLAGEPVFPGSPAGEVVCCTRYGVSSETHATWPASCFTQGHQQCMISFVPAAAAAAASLCRCTDSVLPFAWLTNRRSRGIFGTFRHPVDAGSAIPLIVHPSERNPFLSLYLENHRQPEYLDRRSLVTHGLRSLGLHGLQLFRQIPTRRSSQSSEH